jgi:hypothetical protein
MGSVGTSSNNVIAFPNKSISQPTEKWKYPGDVERVDKLEQAANSAKTVNQINKVALALKQEDEHITTLLNQADEDGDQNTLLTLRRRVRQLRDKVRL